MYIQINAKIVGGLEFQETLVKVEGAAMTILFLMQNGAFISEELKVWKIYHISDKYESWLIIPSTFSLRIFYTVTLLFEKLRDYWRVFWQQIIWVVDFHKILFTTYFVYLIQIPSQANWAQSLNNVLNGVFLVSITHFSPMFHFITPEYVRNEALEMKHWTKIG